MAVDGSEENKTFVVNVTEYKENFIDPPKDELPKLCFKFSPKNMQFGI